MPISYCGILENIQVRGDQGVVKGWLRNGQGESFRHYLFHWEGTGTGNIQNYNLLVTFHNHLYKLKKELQYFNSPMLVSVGNIAQTNLKKHIL